MSELDNNIRKRENFTANIIFSIIFGAGSFIFYKITGENMWAIFLFIASIILLFCYSNILQLEEENIELNNALMEEENEEEEYVDDIFVSHSCTLLGVAGKMGEGDNKGFVVVDG